MSYVPPRELLRGLSIEKVSCYGMPHYGAEYRTRSINSNRLIQGARCAFCHQFATNSHHEPARRNGTFKLHGYDLKPALISLCGSGTSGCHGKRHAGRLRIRWEWKCDLFAYMWWSGIFFELGYRPHDPLLYKFGGWVFEWER